MNNEQTQESESESRKEFLKLQPSQRNEKRFLSTRSQEKCFSRSRVTGSDDPFISVVSTGDGERDTCRDSAFISVWRRVIPPPLRTISTSNDAISLADRTRCIVQARADCLFLQLAELSYRSNISHPSRRLGMRNSY